MLTGACPRPCHRRRHGAPTAKPAAAISERMIFHCCYLRLNQATTSRGQARAWAFTQDARSTRASAGRSRNRTASRPATRARRRGRGLHAQVGQDHEHDHEHGVQPLVPARAIADRRAGLWSSQGRKNRMTTAPPITTTPQNLASMASIRAMATTAATTMPPLTKPGRRALEHAKTGTQHHAGNQHVHHLGGDGTQHRIERREVPHRAMCAGVFSGSAGMKLLYSRK